MFVVVKLDVVNKNASLLKLFKIDQSKTKNFWVLKTWLLGLLLQHIFKNW